ncbi:MAG: hypothetical protein ACXIUB_04460 [Wenzhouxiangella sp.]
MGDFTTRTLVFVGLLVLYLGWLFFTRRPVLSETRAMRSVAGRTITIVIVAVIGIWLVLSFELPA